MEVTKALSEYIVNLKFSDLPKDGVEGAKLCFLDWLGVTLSGSKEPLTHILAAVAEEQRGGARSREAHDTPISKPAGSCRKIALPARAKK